MAHPGIAPTSWRLPSAPRPRPWSGTAQGLGSRIFNAGRNVTGPPKPVPHPAAPSPVQANSNIAPGALRPPPADPRDSMYYAQLAAGQAGANNQIAQLQFQSKTEKAALGERLRLLGEQEPVARQGATNQANLQGLLYSGALGRQQGDIGVDFLRQRTGAQGAFDTGEQSRQMETDALNRAWGEGGTEAWRLLQEAVARASEQAMSAPLVEPSASASAPAATPIVVAPRKNGPGRPRGSGANRPRPWSGSSQGLGTRIFNAGKRKK